MLRLLRGRRQDAVSPQPRPRLPPPPSSTAASASSAASSIPGHCPCPIHSPVEPLATASTSSSGDSGSGRIEHALSIEFGRRPAPGIHGVDVPVLPKPGLSLPPATEADAASAAAVAVAAVPTPATTDEKGRCLVCRQEKRAARRYRWKVVVGLLFPFALQALDVTIISSALPWIATDFGAVSQLNWIVSAFNLTSAAFIPFWGQAADLVGRHAAIQAALVVMLAGSALCTAAPVGAFPVLLLGRGIQGLGCAGLNVVVRVILLDRVSLQENAKNWSIFSFTAGMSYGVGPVLGGALTTASWRWCFAINLPIGAAAVVLVYAVLRPELLGPRGGGATTLRGRLATLDAGGQLLFLAGFGLLILALTWAGAAHRWRSAAVLVPLGAGAVLVALLAAYEQRMAPGRRFARMWPRQTPMLPWALLGSKDMGLLFYINFATGGAMYSVLYFCNLYFTMVKMYGPTYAGTQLLYYTPGLGVGVYLSMFFLNAWPRNTFAPLLLGAVVEAVGVGVLAWALWAERLPGIFGFMAMAGAGTGLRLMPTSLHAVGFFPQHVATVVALLAVALPLGGTLALTMGIVWAFVAITPAMITCVVAAVFLGNVSIAKDAHRAPTRAGGPRSTSPADARGADHVVRGVYLLTVLRRRRRPQQAGGPADRSTAAPSGPAAV